MRYLCLIYTDESTDPKPGDAGWEPLMVEYIRFGEDLAAAGITTSGEALQPTATATTVRLRDGEVLTTDGPYAETKEQLGGFYLLECKDLDEAIQWASRIPGAKVGAIEVRPVIEFD